MTRSGLSIVFVSLLFVSGSTERACAQGKIDDAIVMDEGQRTPEVSTAELRRILHDHSATVFDARPFKEYAMGHIPGAVNVAPQPGMSRSLYISDVDEIGRDVHLNSNAPIVLYCNGPYCEKTIRLADDLLGEGYRNVRRYQLGMPVWRALGGPVQIELAGVAFVMANDRSAVFIDARDPDQFRKRTLPDAMNLPLSRLGIERNSGEIKAAEDDGRLPMDDHNTRIIVFGDNEEQSSAVAETLAKEGFTNVAFFGGSLDELYVAAAADQHE